MKTILLIFAHPDDEILGCGGTVARLIKEGYKAFTLILGEGITSRDEKRNRKLRKKELEELKTKALQANNILGVEKVFFYEFPDNRFDTVPLLEIVKKIEKIKNEVKPDIIFTHYYDDLNIDHKITYQAVITATRPTKTETVKEIYSCEILSSTEWNYPLSFNPDTYFDISSTFNLKIEAIKKYESELRDYPHPRSIKGIETLAKYRGIQVGVKYAESFKTVRRIL